jgi:hypothetical protein
MVPHGIAPHQKKLPHFRAAAFVVVNGSTPFKNKKSQS